ncbi:thiamine phosphate synthase [Bhargavaea cecembensis]|uniref:thiamine phosphate synthase n=1 Tax=Bhargavaea cecembensis TaxID=394098 RepID=UPI000694FCAA|nr:thiamine phosphate synthase [Bhargavaea cecembensis]
MGSRNAAGRDPLQVLEAALRGGVTCFQLREKGKGRLVGEELHAFGAACRDLCRSHGVPFIVNDDAGLAVSLGADGLHIGQEDGDIREVRERIGGDMTLGVSAHDPEEARAAVQAGADYIGMGPVYATSSKPDARPVAGTEPIRAARREHPELPIVGIGGIGAANAAPVIRSGADGVSLITAISHAPDPERAAHDLRRTVDATLIESGAIR